MADRIDFNRYAPFPDLDNMDRGTLLDKEDGSHV